MVFDDFRNKQFAAVQTSKAQKNIYIVWTHTVQLKMGLVKVQ